MPAETFEELFQMVKEDAELNETEDCDVTVEAERDYSAEVSESMEVKEIPATEDKKSETEDTQKEEELQIRGNYSKASADRIWKDLK